MFHVVHIKWNGRHIGYEIWCNNKSFLDLTWNLELKRLEAYKLARMMNGSKIE